jgi:hypothetical protein
VCSLSCTGRSSFCGVCSSSCTGRSSFCRVCSLPRRGCSSFCTGCFSFCTEHSSFFTGCFSFCRGCNLSCTGCNSFCRVCSSSCAGRISFCTGCSSFCTGCISFCKGSSALCRFESGRLAWFKHFVSPDCRIYSYARLRCPRKFCIAIWATFYASSVGDWVLLTTLSVSVIKITPKIFPRGKSSAKYMLCPKFFPFLLISRLKEDDNLHRSTK